MSLYHSYLKILSEEILKESSDDEKIKQLLLSPDETNRQIAVSLLIGKNINPVKFINNSFGDLLANIDFKFPEEYYDKLSDEKKIEEISEELGYVVELLEEKTDVVVTGYRNPLYLELYKNLRELTCMNCDFEQLSFDVSKTPKLNTLFLRSSMLDVHPNILKQLTNLNLIHTTLENHNISNDYFIKAPNLKSLIFNNVSITKLPESIYSLKSLSKLYIRYNKPPLSVDVDKLISNPNLETISFKKSNIEDESVFRKLEDAGITVIK